MSAPHPAYGDVALHAAIAGGSGWQALWEVLARGWSWTVLPPLLVAIAALIGAYRSLRADVEKWADARQDRRHKDELHRLEVERRRLEIERSRTVPDRHAARDAAAIVERNMGLVEQPREHFGGMPICPFAKWARQRGNIKFVVRPFDLGDDLGEASPLIIEYRQWLLDPHWAMLWFFDPDTTMPYPDYYALYERVRDKLDAEEMDVYAGHAEHPFAVGGEELQNEPWPNIQIMRRSTLLWARGKLQRTKYYDRLSEAELRLMGVM